MEIIFVRPCDINIKRALQLADQMIELARIGDAEREDTGCGILYGVLLDSAYKLKRLAEKEKEKHIKKGWWKNDFE
ncbi:MAG: hypothetical protein PVF36_10320 [Desulfobacterales bacterium]|jgi:hypothetical protein